LSTGEKRQGKHKMTRTAVKQLPVIDPPPVDRFESIMLDHIEYLKYRHPLVHERLDKSVINNTNELVLRARRVSQIQGHGDFDDDERGAAYRAGQLVAPRAREYGDRKIFAEVERRLGGFNFKQVGLDVIGGNGTTARVAANLLPLVNRPTIIAGDPNLDMVNDALARGHSAVWQSAQETMFADKSLDFVIGSRGFHHVSPDARAAAFGEARRILRPGGVVLVVDFEEGSPTARWYSEGLDIHTNTGHRFSHFQREELMSLLIGAGFSEPSVFEIYDPFRFWADTAEGARDTLLRHVIGMFGMVRLPRNSDETERQYWARIDRTVAPWCTFGADEMAFDPEALRRLSVFQEADGTWRAEFPRIALCAAGIRR
jgi:SAM-dependent methyltransferase